MPDLCVEPGCLAEAAKRRYCHRHYMQHYRAGDFRVPEPTPDPAPVPTATDPVPVWTGNPGYPAPVAAPTVDVTGLSGALSAAISGSIASALADSRVPALQQEVAQLRAEVDTLRAATAGTYRIEVASGAPVPPVPDGRIVAHYLLPTLCEYLAAGINTMLVGPAGSGKTTVARQAAEALGRPFFQSGAILQKYELTGYQDATGRYVESSFYKAYVQGGVFLWDEIDASDPSALVAFNSALSNGHADFPCGTVERHDAFVAVGAANTYGRGADRQYVGRNQLDAATLDRYAVLECEYDERLEEVLCGLEPDVPAHRQWARREYSEEQIREYGAHVRNWRARVVELGIRHVISPRASIQGCALLRRGVPMGLVESSLVWKGLDTASVDKIKAGE